MFAGIETFARSVDVVENELIDPKTVPGRFGEIPSDSLDMLERYRMLTAASTLHDASSASC